MSTLRRFLLIAVIAFGVSLSAAEDPARRLWMSGYEMLNQAEQERENDSPLAALHSYEKALEVFRQVEHTYPKWNTALIEYRINYCNEQIDALRRANSENEAFMTVEDIRKRYLLQADELHAVKERYSAAQREIQDLRKAVERARAEAAGAAAAADNLRLLRQDRDELTKQLRQLSSQLQSAQEDLAKAKQDNLQSRALQAEELGNQLRDVQRRLADASRELAQTTTERDKLAAQSERERAWRADAEKRLAAFRQEREMLTADLERLKQGKNAGDEAAIPASPAVSIESINDIGQLKNLLHQRTDALRSAQIEVLTLRRKLELAESSVSKYTSELKEFQARAATQADEHAKELQATQDIRAANDAQRRRIDELSATVSAQKELLAKLEGQYHDTEAARKELQEQADALKRQLAQEEQHAKDAAADQERLKQQATLAADGIAALAAENAQKLTETARERDAAQEALAEARRQLASAQSANAELTAKLNAQLQNQSEQNEKLWQERISALEGELTKAVEQQHAIEVLLIKRDNEKQTLEAEIDNLRKSLNAAAAPALPAAAGKSAVPPEVPAPAAPEAVSVSDIIIQGYLRQGIDAERDGKIESAQWNYEQALSLQPDNLIALKRLGLIAANAAQDAAAAKYLGQAFRLNPDDPEVLVAHGFAMLRLNRPQWALSSLSRAAALKPDDAAVARLYAAALASLKWREAAMMQFQLTLKLNPKDGEAAFNLALLTLSHASELERQGQLNPLFRAGYEGLAAAERKKALQWYRTAVENGAQPDANLEEKLK